MQILEMSSKLRCWSKVFKRPDHSALLNEINLRRECGDSWRDDDDDDEPQLARPIRVGLRHKCMAEIPREP